MTALQGTSPGRHTHPADPVGTIRPDCPQCRALLGVRIPPGAAAPTSRERGAVVDLAWEVRGGSIRLSLHLHEPLGQFEVTQLGEVVRRIEALVSTIDHLTDLDRHPAPADLGPE